MPSPPRSSNTPNPFQLSKPELKALFARLGGEEHGAEKLEQILIDFYQRMSQDLLIGFFFEGKDLNDIALKQKSFLMRAMGATPSYSGKAPAQAHEELAPILRGHFDRRLRILETVLKDHGVSDEDIRIWITFENAFREGIQKE